MHKKDKLINVILNCAIVITSFLLVINLILNFQTKILKKEYSSFFNYSLFEIKTGSMSGKLEIGDWILVKKTSNLALNDIITYTESGNFITHRVVEIYNDIIVTKGDSNNSKDTPISSNQVVGKVVLILPKLGIFKNVLFNYKVLISILIVFVVFISLFDKKTNNKKLEFNNFIKINTNQNKNRNKRKRKNKKYNNDLNNNQDNNNDLSETITLSRINVNMSSQLLESIKINNNTEEKEIQEELVNDDIPYVIYNVDENGEEII